MKKDLSGKIFHRLRVLNSEMVSKRSGRRRFWKCVCECGGKVLAQSIDLESGRTKSCGCWNRDRIKKHGRNGTAEYHAWIDIQTRCKNKNSSSYHHYGGRGISICPRWNSELDENAFQNFLDDMGEKPHKSLSIDRIDNDGNYEPGNCRWATQSNQLENQRRSRIYILGGIKQCRKQWAKLLEIPESTLRYRLDKRMETLREIACGRFDGVCYG